MYQLKLPDYSKISDDRKEYLLKNADELCKKCGLGKYLDDEYYPREKLRYMEIPSEFNNPEELHFVVNHLRKGTATLVKNEKGEYFSLSIPPFVQELISDLDRKGLEAQSGMYFSQTEKNYLSQEGIIDEAISSSQIEGAQTTANVAKDMIIRNKEPKNKHEIMIVNNYETMLFITNEINNAVLSEELLLDLQTRLTKNSLDDPGKSGRFRKDEDEIAVINPADGEVYHIPPKEKVMREELKSLIDFANDQDGSYMHPFIKATILHFWIAYLHPFCDGNGRTARAIFYRYLNKKGYKDFTYIPISRAIYNSKKQYGDSYTFAEQEGLNLTFFLVYIAQKTQQAFREYRSYIIKQKEEHQKIQNAIIALFNEPLNERQLSLISYFVKNPEKYVNSTIYQNQYKVTKNTAKSDLSGLTEIGLLQVKHVGNFINYYPTKKLLGLGK